MSRAIDIARLVMLIALTCVCVAAVAGGYVVTVKVLTEMDAVTVATKQISAAKVGVIPLVEDDLRNLRLTLDNANKAALDERFFLEKAQPVELAKINEILDSSNQLVKQSGDQERQIADSATATLHTASDAIKDIEPLETHLDATVQALTVTTNDLDKLVSDPENVKTLGNVQVGTAAMAETAKDGQQWFYQALHPTWVHKVWGVMLDVAHVFNPL
jgi:hypothetical protein